MTYDLVITGGHAVLPGVGVTECDVGVIDGRIAAVVDDLSRATSHERISARGKVVIPGGVDAHFHLGVYRDLAEDTASETASAAAGGVTSILSYFRTGGHYVGQMAPYRELWPQVLEEVRGNAYVDFGFHVAPMTPEHLDEVPWLVEDAGIASFKYYFHYTGASGREYAMVDEYDLGHLYALMELVVAADRRHGTDGRVSLSLHCESADLIRLFTERVRAADLPDLQRYSASRPPIGERLSIHEAGVLGSETGVRLNLLHLSSAEALDGARQVRQLYPQLDVRLETTTHHLCLTYEELEEIGAIGKVNPPLRGGADRDALWDAVRRGEIDWVASDHACCLETLKLDLDSAVPGYGGAAVMLPALVTEGHLKRGLPLERIVALFSEAPARAFGCYPAKGALAPGADADLVVVDLDEERIVTPELLHSAQDFSPFEGRRFSGWPVTTILRGEVVFADGDIVGAPRGAFVRRPIGQRPAITRAAR